MQFGEGAFPEFSQSLLLTIAFKDDDEYEYDVYTCKEEILKAHDWAASVAVRGEK